MAGAIVGAGRAIVNRAKSVRGARQASAGRGTPARSALVRLPVDAPEGSGHFKFGEIIRGTGIGMTRRAGPIGRSQRKIPMPRQGCVRRRDDGRLVVIRGGRLPGRSRGPENSASRPVATAHVRQLP